MVKDMAENTKQHGEIFTVENGRWNCNLGILQGQGSTLLLSGQKEALFSLNGTIS
jgi:hypothetical protein